MLNINTRVRAANAVLKAVAANGRRHLYSLANDRSARLGRDKAGQVWYVDHITGMLIYPFGSMIDAGSWRGFSGGPAERALVAHLARHIKVGCAIEQDLIDDALAGYSDADKALVREAIQGAAGEA